MGEWTSEVRYTRTQRPIYWPRKTAFCCMATQHQQHFITEVGMLTQYINRLSLFVVTVLWH
jgi:hypothetical protein